jgi:hypothetical protein
MAQIPGSIPVTGKIAPTDTADVFATHESQYGIGDKHVVDLTARDAITTERRVWGMMCHLEDGTSYQLVKGLVDTDLDNNANWKSVSLADSPLTVAAGSANYLDITNNEISVSALLVTSVTEDAAVDLATFIAASYTVGDEFQEGDVIILSTPSEVYIHNGATLAPFDETHFTSIEVPQLTDTYIRNLLSATGPLSYNPVTGDFTIAQANTSTDGYISSTDWNTFNNKVSFPEAPNDGEQYVRKDLGWEQLATASGVCGIADSSGAYTFYSTLTLALAAASAGDTVQVFTDITETGAVEIVLKDGVNINLNGHTYTLNVATTENAFVNDVGTVECSIFNGTIKRTGGSASLSQYLCFDLAVETKITFNGVNIINDAATALRSINLNSEIIGGNFDSPYYGVQIYNGGIGRNIHSYSSGDRAFYVSGSLYDCTAHSDGGYGIELVGAGNAYNCTAYSSSNVGIWAVCSGEIIGCVGYSDVNAGIRADASGGQIDCTGFSKTTYGLIVAENILNSNAYSEIGDAALVSATASNCTFESIGTGRGAYISVGVLYNCYAKSAASDAVYIDGFGGDVFNCTLEVVDSSQYCIDVVAGSTHGFGQNTFKGATVAVNPVATNTQTNTTDTFGNLLIG